MKRFLVPSTVGTDLAKVISPCAKTACGLKTKTQTSELMPRFVIERTIPNAGQMSARELHDISAKCNSVLRDVGPQLQWVESYVTDNKVYCLYIAPGPELIREHAVRGGFPLDTVTEVKAVIDPITAE